MSLSHRVAMRPLSRACLKGTPSRSLATASSYKSTSTRNRDWDDRDSNRQDALEKLQHTTKMRSGMDRKTWTSKRSEGLPSTKLYKPFKTGADAEREPELSRKPSRYRVTPGAGQKAPTKMNPTTLPKMLIGRVDEWIDSERVQERLKTYGFRDEEGEETLTAWAGKIKEELRTWDEYNESLVPKMAELGWDAQALILAYEAGEHGEVFESAFLRHFITYASESGPERLHLHLKSLLITTDMSNLPQSYPLARNINRQFHLHMGPTNSGKTYNALKALARAKTGVYAGPLRLLAHEVWERLNLGAVGGLNGNRRACNLITGEERRMVSSDAGLVACTVEMVPLAGHAGESWDVVVIDEIQMMGDSYRGGAWTNAVMGVNAKEIHLCGDETTAALLQTMIDGFHGDTLTVHRYDRLTPLSVADKSLEGDWNNIQPGDCVVTFSRSNVFSVKKSVESTLGKRCSVVYGALPPETRAEQARQFNESNGRAEVMVASDAVGMGLNLKINRIIFESLSKFDGKNEVPLSLSSVKQIAGRAGRFGQTRSNTATTAEDNSDNAITDEIASAGGVVTTLHAADLPLLRAMLPLSLPPLTRATIDFPPAAINDLAPLLPASTTYADLLENFGALVKLPPNTVLSDISRFYTQADAVESFRDVLTIDEVEILTLAPFNRRDPKVAAIFGNMVRSFATDFHVSIDDVLEESRLLRTLKTVEETLAALPPLPPTLGIYRQYLAPPITIAAIPLLESLHKALVVYIWLSFRLELGFPDRQLASEYKARTEKVLDICLERMPGLRQRTRSERTKEMDNVHALYRRKYVDKHGLVKPSIEWVDHAMAQQDKRGDKWRHLAQIWNERPPKH